MNEVSNGFKNPLGQGPLPVPLPKKSFWQENRETMIRLLFLVIILGGAVAYGTYVSNNKNLPEKIEIRKNTEMQDKITENNTVKVTDLDKGKTNVVVTNPNADQKVSGSKNSVTIIAEKGDGYTHLARRALAEYLKNFGEKNLSAEHKIYIEDYLQKKVSQKNTLQTGDQVSFSQDDLQGAIESALNLSQSQIQNLHKYAVLVPGL